MLLAIVSVSVEMPRVRINQSSVVVLPFCCDGVSAVTCSLCHAELTRYSSCFIIAKCVWQVLFWVL